MDYRPYKSAQELMEQFENDIDMIPNWVVNKYVPCEIKRFNGISPCNFDGGEDVVNVCGDWITLDDFFKKFNWKDGTKCGVKEEK